MPDSIYFKTILLNSNNEEADNAVRKNPEK